MRSQVPSGILSVGPAIGYFSIMNSRHYSFLDRLCINLDQGVRTVFGHPLATGRSNPAAGLEDAPLADSERRHVAGLMRVDHAGEVSAQALYQGQALTARKAAVREGMERAAQEENDHLAWCEQRLTELGDHPSRLNAAWYLGSFTIGALAGIAGDKWSLGFVAETERQVVKHLDDHLQRLPPQDTRSQAILAQMKEDEAKHATAALRAGGVELPSGIRRLMQAASRVMTRTAYWV